MGRRMRYLLDTDMCIQAMRGATSVIDALTARAPADIAVSSVTCYELYTGIEKCADPIRERTKVEALIGTLNQVVFDLPAAKEAARIRASLELRGQMIGPYDVLIAGQAISAGLTLVTGNTNEFARVPALSLENWRA